MSNALLRSAAAPAIRESFDEVVLPHLGAGRALARWLVRNEHDAEDVVQEASLRAFRYFRTFAGGDGRAWFLRIVRNACWDWCDRLAHSPTDVFDEELHSGDQSAFDPEAQVLRTDDGRLLEHAMGALPDRFRKLLVHRELDGLSYRELADVMDVPIGTVMSGLSRARQALRVALNNELRRSSLPARTTAREEEADAVLA
jgi:RNA polymerase sigma factor (sigma-70 family)